MDIVVAHSWGGFGAISAALTKLFVGNAVSNVNISVIINVHVLQRCQSLKSRLCVLLVTVEIQQVSYCQARGCGKC